MPTMRAIVRDRYGPPAVLRLEQIPVPTPGAGDVLVRVRAASVNAGDWHILRADPFLVRLAVGGLFRPRHRVLGSDVAGVVEAVGAGVTAFRPGDEVFGDLSASGFGAFAEYACAPHRAFAPKPANTTFEEAAALPLAAGTALQGLRDKGRIRAGQRVLIHGASGGVGTCAVQIARAFGAEVHAVCGTANVDMVRSLGAADVVDYTREDCTRGGPRFDLILDTACHRSPLRFRKALRPGGIYVMVGGAVARMFEAMLLGGLVSRFGSRTTTSVMAAPRQADLLAVKDLVDAGRLRPVVARRYELAGVADAIAHLEHGHPGGKLVIRV